MSSILETIMLICVGCSWPMNVIKSYKARTAKSMSLLFILLIITGYIAGILAKIASHQINFVLLVYLLNLAIVSLNLVIYFRNRRLDKIQETAFQDELESDRIDSYQKISVKKDSKHSVAF